MTVTEWIRKWLGKTYIYYNRHLQLEEYYIMPHIWPNTVNHIYTYITT